MALLNPPQILPSVMRVLFRALQAADGFGMAKGELVSLTAPPALSRGEETPAGPGSKPFDDTLNAGVMIGLFSREGDDVRLHPELPNETRERRQGDKGLRPLVRRLMLQEELNAGLWTSTEGARDLTRALAWYLAQSPLAPPKQWNERSGVDFVQEEQLGSGERIFSNDTRWMAFARWACFLGFAQWLPSDAKDVLVPDPTPALREVLPTILSARRQEILPVVTQIGRDVPVLDGGRYRLEVEARMRSSAVRSAPDLLSPSFTHALLALQDEGLIALENLADAPSKLRVADNFGRERTLSHISLAGNARKRGR